MHTKLILIEGLVGFGKSTTAKMVNDILKEMGIQTKLFLEGNLDHPADYDGVSVFSKKEFDELLSFSNEFKDIFMNKVMKKEDMYFLPYRKIENEQNTSFPKPLFDMIFKKDIYEIPLDQNIELISNRWRAFAETAVHDDHTYIFECCFMQNPLAIGMMKENAPNEQVIDYVMQLSETIEHLNPLLIYIEQDDLAFSFNKALTERSKEWSEGFIQYATNQGYGKMHGLKGAEGTLKVLEARRQLESQILDMLKMNTIKVNNSNYDMDTYKLKLADALKVSCDRV
ncbi:hypothetical protein [Longirhabdus pacifica]|uniref:hypothetical protein n=1 Tax=Longirhabdus pacifica TaxID=2305227 RepID=UPI0010092104|nr:hypothetical protein [Longirhabdus pacifica]